MFDAEVHGSTQGFVGHCVEGLGGELSTGRPLARGHGAVAQHSLMKRVSDLLPAQMFKVNVPDEPVH